MDDFPPICKQDPLEVRVMFIKEYYELTGQVIKISDIPDEMYEGALPIIPQQEAHEADDSEHEDPGNVVEISSGNSSSLISSDSSYLSEGTVNVIRHIDEKLHKAAQSVPNKTDSVNQQTSHTSPEVTSSPDYFIPLQMILPELVAETVAPESVQVTVSESPVTVTVYEPNQQQQTH